MIHYHGGPITPYSVAVATWKGRHGMTSFARPEQTGDMAELCQSFAIDNGAFSIWSKGGTLDVAAYAEYVREWMRHPGFDWCLMPDTITGTEQDNANLIAQWLLHERMPVEISVPVWHLHESLERLDYLCRCYPRVALGSSGDYSEPGAPEWWDRMHEAMGTACDDQGRPRVKLHGLRMLNPTVFSQLPLASADSTNVARNHVRARQNYHCSPTMAALLLVDRIEAHASAPRYAGTRGTQMNMELVG